METQLHIYVLKLKDEKYYVGKTHSAVEQRWQAHQTGFGSKWTQKYPPVQILETFAGDEFDEDKVVLQYMDAYGIENVRGGSYSNLDLTFEQQLQIWRSLNNAKNKCLACGLHGHFIDKCTTAICYRCGRVGHSVENCFAHTHKLGGVLNGCYRCGRQDHWAFRCNRSADCFGRKLTQSECSIM